LKRAMKLLWEIEEVIDISIRYISQVAFDGWWRGLEGLLLLHEDQ
jgi:hypothetical protein